MDRVIEARKQQVGHKIRTARLHAGLSHDRLAAAVGTSRQHLIKLEKGQHLPGRLLLAAIARETGKAASFFDSEKPVPEADDKEGDPVVDLEYALRRIVHQTVREHMAGIA